MIEAEPDQSFDKLAFWDLADFRHKRQNAGGGRCDTVAKFRFWRAAVAADLPCHCAASVRLPPIFLAAVLAIWQAASEVIVHRRRSAEADLGGMPPDWHGRADHGEIAVERFLSLNAGLGQGADARLSRHDHEKNDPCEEP